MHGVKQGLRINDFARDMHKFMNRRFYLTRIDAVHPSVVGTNVVAVGEHDSGVVGNLDAD
ncbi:hypothetical protein [Rhodococcus erythropolis]|uniref:hypothetical protein n=1 Tax=Rhodococcus erythropolis TaxID=1833 RepID=UPI00083F5CF5|nr:hypothetical protein [Rhodococcus erythropolis]